MIEIKNINYSVNAHRILKDINLSVKEGECLCILGPNGAGKTTLFDILLGFIKPDSGSVSFGGKNFQEIKKTVGVVFDNTPIFYYAKVGEYLAYIARIYGVDIEVARALMKELGIDGLESSFLRALSQGEKKKIGLISALMHDPEILVLDEPTSNLDPFSREQLWNMIKRKRRTIIFTTHIWDEAQKHADRVAFISSGRILAIDTPASFLSKRYIKYKKKVILPPETDLPLKHVHFIETDDKIVVYLEDTNNFVKTLEKKLISFSVLPVSLEDVFLILDKEEKK